MKGNVHLQNPVRILLGLITFLKDTASMVMSATVTFGGEGRIRTYGPVGRTAAIRLLRLQPLSHLSVMVNDGQ
jgi:hypothetical protein